MKKKGDNRKREMEKEKKTGEDSLRSWATVFKTSQLVDYCNKDEGKYIIHDSNKILEKNECNIQYDKRFIPFHIKCK